MHVDLIINVGTSRVESDNCVTLAQDFTHVYAAIGTHPNDATDSWKADTAHYKKLAKFKYDNKIVAIGEIGLDYHYPNYNKQLQYDVFKAQIEIALEFDLALIIHTRDAHDETLTILEEYKHQGIRGVIHCFSEDVPFAKHAQELGFMLGIGGTITYPKNELLRDVCKAMPLSSLILETDAPFLPPQPLRGTQNSPTNIPMIAQYLADLKGVTLQDVASSTTNNARTLFTIDQYHR
jgi:TatD DNase family protein